jgi:hypothetical protein
MAWEREDLQAGPRREVENKRRGGPSETIMYASGPQHLTEQRSRMRLVRALAGVKKKKEREGKGVDG